MGTRPINAPASPLQDRHLSLKARGAWTILTEMAGPDQTVRSAFQRLLEESEVDGQQSVRTAMRELQDRGYVEKMVLRHPGGSIAGYSWRLIASPDRPAEEDLQKIA